MDAANLKILVDVLFAGALLAAKGRPVVSTFLNLAKNWIDSKLTDIADHMAKN